MKASVYNFKNEVVGEIELPKSLFEARWRPTLVKQVLEAQLANRRSPWAHAKDRSEVRGGGRKPWRQKGTGRARHGSIRSPLWSGGGKAHGPSKLRDYSQKVNKKMKQGALFAVLSKKLKDGEIRFFDSLDTEPKTKMLVAKLAPFFTEKKKKAKKFNLLLIPNAENKMLYRAAANLVKTKVLAPQSLNLYDLMNYAHVFVDQRAVAAIEKQYSQL